MRSDSGNDVLTLANVGMRFGERTVLRSIDLSIKAGEFIGLIGQNGAGKTTLLRIILGLLKPTDGTVSVLGTPVKRGNRAIGYVPQKVHIDPDTPLRGRDLAGLGLDGHRLGFPLPLRSRREKIESALASVDALHLADSPVGRMSGGEQQRILIAQALLTEPAILLLDEPLANLDIRSSREVVQLVAAIAQKRQVAVILVSHDMNPLLDVMTRVLYLAQGRAAIGTVDQVVQSDVLSTLYGYNVEVLRLRNRILVVGGLDSEVYDEDLAGISHCATGEEMRP